MKKQLIFIVALIIIVILSGIGLAVIETKNKNIKDANKMNDTGYVYSFTDYNGQRITLSKKPETIVVLATSTAETLCELGLTNNIVGISEEIKYPSQLLSKAKVGSFSNVLPDDIIKLKPDIVFASKYTYQNTINELMNSGIPTAYLEANTYNEMLDSINILSDIFLIKEKGQSIVENTKNKVSDAVNKNTLTAKPKILYIQSLEPLYVAGNNTCVNDIIVQSGAENAAAEVNGYGEMNILQLQEKMVDIILMPSSLSKDYNTDYFKSHNIFKDMAAVKKNNIAIISDDTIFVNATPRINLAIEKVVTAIMGKR